MVPPLYGGGGNNHDHDTAVIAPLARTRPLTGRQLELCSRCLDVMRAFLHADGSEDGLSMEVLDGGRWSAVQELIKFYWKDIGEIERRYCDVIGENVEDSQSAPSKDDRNVSNDCTKSKHPQLAKSQQPQLADGLLQLLRIRMQHDRRARAFFSEQLRAREKRIVSASGVGAVIEQQ